MKSRDDRVVARHLVLWVNAPSSSKRAISDPAGAPHNGPRTVLDALSRPFSTCSTPSFTVSHPSRTPAHVPPLPTLFSSSQAPRPGSTLGV